MIFTREAYLSQLAQKKQNGMIKIITGLRRCGKSYLLFKLFYDKLIAEGVPKSHIVKIPLDDLEYAELRDKMALYKFVKSKIKDKKQYYCLLDEIQLVEGFEEVLNSLLHIENVDVYVTGNNSRFLVKDVITEFRGRGDEIRMYPLSFREFFEGRKDDFSSAWTDYYTYGGLPLVATMKTHKEKSDYLDNLFSKVYLTDVVDRYSIRNKAEFEELLDVVASSIGSPANPVKIENTFKSKKKSTITHKTITSYLNYLDDAFLIQTAERFDIKGRKYIGANKKYYFSDVGLRNARLNFRQLEESHIMENIIYNELKMRGYNVDVGIVECRAKDKNGSLRQIQLECDFVANLENEKIYIQSALNLADEKKKAQEENSLLKINDSFKKVIVQKEKVVPHYDENGIYIVCLEDFLLGTVL